jgi:predicted acetyltransferase
VGAARRHARACPRRACGLVAGPAAGRRATRLTPLPLSPHTEAQAILPLSRSRCALGRKARASGVECHDDHMPMPTSLRLISTSQQRQITERLWQLYRHDLSEFRGSMPDGAGLYKLGRLPTFFEDPDRCGYLIYSTQALAGFALVRGLAQEPKIMGEFFVVRAARRQRVGYEAAVRLLSLHPGRWAIPFQENNQGAARFWRRVAAEVAGAGCKEERRPVPRKPTEPPDTWLLLTSYGLVP